MKNYQVLVPDWDKKKNGLSPPMVFLKEFLSKVDFKKKKSADYEKRKQSNPACKKF